MNYDISVQEIVQSCINPRWDHWRFISIATWIHQVNWCWLIYYNYSNRLALGISRWKYWPFWSTVHSQFNAEISSTLHHCQHTLIFSTWLESWVILAVLSKYFCTLTVSWQSTPWSEHEGTAPTKSCEVLRLGCPPDLTCIHHVLIFSLVLISAAVLQCAQLDNLAATQSPSTYYLKI